MTEYVPKKALIEQIRKKAQSGREIGAETALMHYLEIIDIIEQMPTLYYTIPVIELNKADDVDCYSETIAHVEYTPAECGYEK